MCYKYLPFKSLINDNQGRGKICEPEIHPNYLHCGILNSLDLGKNHQNL